MQRITKFSAIIGFLAVMTFVIGMFMYMPTITNQGAVISSPIAAFAWGSGCGGCGGDGGGGGGGGGGVYVPPEPVISSCDLYANRTTINAGESAVLTWTTSRVDKVIFNQGIGEVADDGSITVSPTVTTKYSLTAKRNGNVVANCDVTIVVRTVAPNPYCTLTVSPNTIRTGESATLTWTTQNAQTVTFNGNAVEKNGSRVVSPNNTRTFTLVATSADGKTVTCQKTVTVTEIITPNPVCSFDASPNSITNGQSATLTWNTTNASSVSINQNIGNVSVDGSRSVSPTQTTTYTLTATGNGKTVTCQDTIVVNNVTPNLSCDSFSASPSRFGDNGGTTNLSWNTTGANSVSINQGIGSVSDDGNYSVFVGSSRTFTLTASNGTNSVTCNTSVTVDEDNGGGGGGGTSRPSCESFRASDRTIEEGDSVKLSWETRRGEELTIKDNRGDKIFDTDDEDEVDEGDITVSPKRDTTYTLRVEGKSNKTDTCTVKVEVEEGDEVIVTSVRDRQPVTTISFRQVPYTGFDAGPVLAMTFYALLGLWALVASYIVVVKKGSVLGFSLATVGMGRMEKAPVAAYSAPIIARTASTFAPTNLPIARDEEETEEEEEEVVEEEEADEDVSSIENRAFVAGMILSKDAVAVITRAGRDTAERLTIADAIISRAKETFPREDGWIAIDKTRIQSLFN